MYNYSLSIDGVAEWHGDCYTKDYVTDLLANRSVDFITDSVKGEGPAIALPLHRAPDTWHRRGGGVVSRPALLRHAHAHGPP